MTTGHISIYRATSADIDMLMRWRMTVLAEVFSGNPGNDSEALAEANQDYYLRALADGSHVAVFARIGDITAGCGGVCFQREMPSPDNPSGIDAYLMNIYVDPKYRRNGVARAIVTQLVETALDKGAGKIYLETSECGRKLYAGMGFGKLEEMMILK